MGPARVMEWIELERCEAAPNDFVGCAGALVRRFRALRPAISVDTDSVAAWSAEQVVDRLAARLADDVPQPVLQRAQRRPEVHCRTPQCIVQVHDRAEMLDGERAAADEMATHLLQVGHDRPVAVRLGIGLTPTDEPLVRLDLDEEPGLAGPRIDQKRRALGDLHRVLAYGYGP